MPHLFQLSQSLRRSLADLFGFQDDSTMSFTFYLLPGALWGPMGPQGEQKYPKNQFLRKELIFNLFQKSERLLKPKYLDFGAMRNLGILA